MSEEMDAQNAEIAEQLQDEIKEKESLISEYKERLQAQELPVLERMRQSTGLGRLYSH